MKKSKKYNNPSVFKSLKKSMLFVLFCMIMQIPFLQIPLFGQSNTTNLSKSSDTKLRIASYNVYWGSVFPQDNGNPPVPGRFNLQDRSSNFIRIHNALKPDIWAMQEVLYSKIERETKTLQGHLDYFNEETSENWHVAADERGRLIFSRYPIKWKKKIALRMFAVLIDLPDSISEEDLLLINVHLHWKDPVQRAKEAVLTTNFLNDVIDGKVPEVSSNSMLMVCGDFNSRFNDIPHRIISSINPKIDSTQIYQPVLEDKQPVQMQNGSKITYGATVFENNSKHVVGGTIDFMLFRPGSLTMSNSFILNTLVLDQKILDTYGLKRNDVALHPNQSLEGKIPFDHLPLIADFSNKK